MAKNIMCATTLIFAFGIISLIKGIASEDVHVLVNESTVISCSPNRVLSVQWHHTLPGKSSSEYVYAGGRFYFPYNTDRFRAYSDPTRNTYTLVITNVTLEDAGLYECKDDESSGVFGSTQLIVLNSRPVCKSNMHPDGFIGPNECNLQRENMIFNCSVSFSGKTSPSLMWRSSNGSRQSLVNSFCTTQSNHINCILTSIADPEYDGSVFICETKESNGDRYDCSTELIKVQYFSAASETSTRKVHDNVSCIVNSNLETRYSWNKIEQNGQYVFLSSKRTVVMEKSGIYRCDVEYSIRNNICSFLTPVVDVVDTGGSDSPIEKANVVAIALPIVLLSIVILAVVVAFVIYAKRIKAVRKKRPIDHPDEEENVPLNYLRRTRLDRIQPRLAEICSILQIRKKLIDKLKDLPVINEGFDDADTADDVDARFENLLSTIPQRMDEAFDPFKKALVEINPILADYIDKGEIVAVDITTEMPELDGSLSEAFKDAINQSQHGLVILATSKIFVVAVKPSNSIEVLIYCGEPKDMKTFIEIFNSGVLETFLSDALDKLMLNIQPSNVGSLKAKVYIKQKEVTLIEQFANRNDWLHDKSKIRKLHSTPGAIVDRSLEREERTCVIKFKIEAQREKLLDIVESEFELLPELLRNGALSPNQMDEIKTKSTNALKNARLLDCIFRNAKYHEFLEALQRSGQIHVVNWIEANGIYEPEYGLQWPLTGKEIENIDRNYRHLGEELSIESAFLDLLLESEAINNRQMNFINAKTNKFERNEAFLDILKRFSLRAYFLVTKCLRESNQERIAKILEDGGATVPLHANLEGQNTKEKEEALVELLKADLRKAKIIKIDEYFIVDVRHGKKAKHVTDITERKWNRILQSNYADLLVKIDSSTGGGLEGEFRKLNVFTAPQIRNIWGRNSNIERNKMILSLLERGDLKRFMAVRSALEKSGQQPLVERHLSLIKEPLLTPDDRYKEPLKESYRYQMLVNWNKLLENISDEDGLIYLITERGTLTDYQRAVIKDLAHCPSKLNYLLRLLETGSQQHFDDFCECLKENKQGHIVKKYLTFKSVNRNLDDIPKSFKDMRLCFDIKTKPIRGRVLVISNRSYLDQKRSEVHRNEMNLSIVFEEKLVFQKKPIFDAKLVTNETKQDMMKTLETEQQSQKDYDVFLMFLFSYGNSREIFTIDGQSLKINELFDMFNDEKCPKLKGKPKLFIIQTFERDGALDDSPSHDAKGNFNLKNDMAVVYATVKGEPKDGRELTGTQFTSCLLEVFFNKIQEVDFKEIIEEVLELLRKRDQKITLPNGEVQTVQQLATFQTELTEKVFLVEQRQLL